MVLLTRLNPDTPLVRFFLPCLPPHMDVFRCPVRGHPCPPIPLFPPRALSLCCTSLRILILVYILGTLSFLLPWPRHLVTCSVSCCPPRSESVTSSPCPPVDPLPMSSVWASTRLRHGHLVILHPGTSPSHLVLKPSARCASPSIISVWILLARST